MARGRVLHHVGQRLLNDAVGGQLDHRRQRPGLRRAGRQVQCHRNGEAFGQFRQLGQPRRGRDGRVGTVLAEDRHRRAQLAHRLLAGVPDLLQRRPCDLGPAVERVERDPGLHGHRRHGVRDDVVQLACDPHALLAQPARRLALVLQLGAAGQFVPAAHHLAEQQRDQRNEHLQHRGRHRPPLLLPGDDRGGGREQRARHRDAQGAAAVALHSDEVEGDHHRQVQQLTDVPVHRPGQARGARHPGREQRLAPVREQPEHADREQRPAEPVVLPRPRHVAGQIGGGHAADGHRDQQFHAHAPTVGAPGAGRVRRRE